MPPFRTPVRLPDDLPPQLTVLIDVEEEFDWTVAFDRDCRKLTHLEALEGSLDMFGRHGCVPVWLCTWPVADDPDGAALLRRAAEADRAVIGVHLHPWNTPPHEESLTDRRVSFPGNLPRELETAKIATLADKLEEVSGVRPLVYQAGRYGIGPNTESILEELGFVADQSVCPPFDYSDEGGPDFTRTDPAPRWFGAERPLLSLPTTGAYIGRARRSAHALHSLAQQPGLSHLRAPGILSRLGVVERIRLSPEGFEVGDMQRLTRGLLERGTRILSLSFHSPSLVPGLTTYVRNEAERAAFVARIDRYLDWFTGELGGKVTTPVDLHAQLLDTAPPKEMTPSPAS